MSTIVTQSYVSTGCMHKNDINIWLRSYLSADRLYDPLRLEEIHQASEVNIDLNVLKT